MLDFFVNSGPSSDQLLRILEGGQHSILAAARALGGVGGVELSMYFAECESCRFAP